jgi:hypothetical protein
MHACSNAFLISSESQEVANLSNGPHMEESGTWKAEWLVQGSMQAAEKAGTENLAPGTL